MIWLIRPKLPLLDQWSRGPVSDPLLFFPWVIHCYCFPVNDPLVLFPCQHTVLSKCKHDVFNYTKLVHKQLSPRLISYSPILTAGKLKYSMINTGSYKLHFEAKFYRFHWIKKFRQTDVTHNSDWAQSWYASWQLNMTNAFCLLLQKPGKRSWHSCSLHRCTNPGMSL